MTQDATTKSPHRQAGTQRNTAAIVGGVLGRSIIPRRRPRVRKVTRVVRHIDPWSTFKVGLIFGLVGYIICLTSGVLLWRVAEATGTIRNVERWFTQFGWETFTLKGDEIFSNASVVGLFLTVAFCGGLVLLATLFNLVSDIVGGVRVSILEEEVVERMVTPNADAATIAEPDVYDYADWSVDDENGHVDDASHANPVATELADLVRSTPTTGPDAKGSEPPDVRRDSTIG